MLGKELEPILLELEDTIWNHEAVVGLKPEFSDEAFRASIKIFLTAFMDKMHDFHEEEEVDHEDAKKMVSSAADELRRLVKNFTGFDTLKMYK